MNLNTQKDTPPWDWPKDIGNRLLKIVRNRVSSQAERILATELAGDMTVIDDEIGSALLCIVHSSDESEDMRNTAAVALGPILENADSFGFEDPDEIYHLRRAAIVRRATP